MEKILILVLIIINAGMFAILANVVKTLDVMRTAINKNFLELGKRQITISDRIDAVSDVFDRLSEPLDRMDKNVSDMANMTEDTHLKMLYAYNEIEKVKVHGKHVGKDNTNNMKKCVVTSIPCVSSATIDKNKSEQEGTVDNGQY